MKILFFASYYLPYLSGITTYPYKIFTFLAKENDVTVLTFLHSKKLKLSENIEKVKVIRMPYLFRISKGFISFRSWPYFFSYAKNNDLIFLNIPNAEGLPLAFFGKIFGKRVISIFHCRVDLKGGVFAKIASFLLNFSVYLQLWLSDEIVIYTDDYFSNLKWEKKFATKTRQIFPPVDILPVGKKEQNKFIKEKGDDIWIGFAGRVAKEKGIDVLIDAVDELTRDKKMRSKMLKIVFAGPYGDAVVGEENYFFRIKKMLEEKNLSHCFYGSLHGKALGSFYDVVDVLVLPSTNKTEAFGMVQVEAMQLGAPVIASNLPGVRVPLEETGMGLVVEPGDVGGLSSALKQILTYPRRFTNNKKIISAQKIFNSDQVYYFYKSLLLDDHRQ